MGSSSRTSARGLAGTASLHKRRFKTACMESKIDCARDGRLRVCDEIYCERERTRGRSTPAGLLQHFLTPLQQHEGFNGLRIDV